MSLPIHKRKIDRKGFTLIELLVVFTIIGLISTIGIFLSMSFIRNQSVNTTAEDIRSMLYSARSQSQSVVSTQCTTSQFTGIQVRFCNAKDKNNISCSTSQCVSNGNPDYQMELLCGGNYQATLQQKNLPSNVTIQPDNCTVSFQPFGASVVGNGNITVSGFGTSQVVSVNTTGVIQ